MHADEFYERVRRESPVETADRARAATEATLEALAETLTAGQAEDVAAQLPAELAGAVENADHDAAGYDREAFVNAVAERLRGIDLDGDDADRYAPAVIDALAESLTRGELENLRAQLSADLDALFADRAGS